VFKGLPSAQARKNLLFSPSAILLLASFTAAYVVAHSLYFSVLSWFEFSVAAHPFLDIENVVLEMSCAYQEVDVLAGNNPCTSGPS
jgi:hypothetical protein